MQLIYRSVSVIIIVVVSAFVLNYFSPAGIALTGHWNTDEGVISANGKKDIVERSIEIASVELAKEIYDKRNVIFVDARSTGDFLDGRIKGAVSLPLNEFYDKIDDFIEKYPLADLLVTYCSGRECEDSHKLAQCFIDEGYENVRVFIDGFPAWKNKGFPVAND